MIGLTASVVTQAVIYIACFVVGFLIGRVAR